MADEEETAAPTYSVEYLGAGKTEEPIGWISKAGKANVKYANGDTYCGDYNELKQRHGRGRYTYIRKGNEEDEEASNTSDTANENRDEGDCDSDNYCVLLLLSSYMFMNTESTWDDGEWMMQIRNNRWNDVQVESIVIILHYK